MNIGIVFQLPAKVKFVEQFAVRLGGLYVYFLCYAYGSTSPTTFLPDLSETKLNFGLSRNRMVLSNPSRLYA